MAQGTPYKPVAPGQLYLDGKTFAGTLDGLQRRPHLAVQRA